MTIYNQISNNKNRTILIFVLFVLFISGFFFLIGQYFESPISYLTIGIIFSSLSTIGSYFFSDKIVLMMSGAEPADKKRHFNFYTVTENLAIASGLPMPKLYVINDPAPNAFATGRNPKNALVCVTTGLLDRLDRAELEGVIAHELSHIKNYDILLSTVVAVLVGTIAMVSEWIMRSFWWHGIRDRDNNRESRNPLSLLLFVIALVTGPVVATLIQLAISRSREYLADASGALITRYPEGLARALEKIKDDPTLLKNAHASTAHLFINSPFKKKEKTNSWFLSLFSTHPPIEERIKLLRQM